MNLEELGKKYKTRKVFHHYLPVYEKYFNPIREKVKKVLELGILDGASLRMWEEYFPNAEIIGFDIKSSDVKGDRIHTFKGDVSERDDLYYLIEEYGGDYDIIVDDCGHWQHQQQIAMGYLFRYIKPGGFFVMEDLTAGRDYKPYYLCPIVPVMTGNKDLNKTFKYEKIIHIWLGKYGVFSDMHNTTLKCIKDFIKEDMVNSVYMYDRESNYLEEHTEYMDLHEECIDKDDADKGIICFIKKKDDLL